jgi:hypothetical protein
MITLSFWESLVVGMALSFLTALQSKLKNQIELDALAAAISFLNQLLAGTVGKSA